MEEDSEDVSELEARLYSQVHHEPASTELQLVAEPNSNISQDVNFRQKCRYWGGGKPSFRYTKHINPFAELSQVEKEDPVQETLPSIEVKPFRPYVPYLTEKEVIPVASGDDPEPKGSASKLISGENSKKESTSSGKSFKSFPLNRNIAKLSKAIKFQLKKMKANQAREKRMNQKRSALHTIILDDSSDDEDEVIEIPVPAPPTVTIDSSGESEMEVDESNTFLKPQGKNQEKINSRCVSPSSVMSDDFIGQTDRSRILHHKDVADDEDLVYLQETVENCVYQGQSKESTTPNQESMDIAQEPNFATPKKKTYAAKNADYNVTQTNFRALDVYESESSDIPENDKEKDKTPITPSNPVAEIEKERTKKLKKRRKSGSAKESEAGDNSTDSEEERVPAKSGLPFILRGEAVESCKENNRKQSAAVSGANTSDNEFINMLTTISQAKNVTNQSESEKSIDSCDNITAREMAEDVLNRKSDSQDCVEVVMEEKSEAIPLDASTDIEKILDNIDKIHSVLESPSENNESCEIEEYTGEEPILSITDIIKQQRPGDNTETDNGLYVVYTHGKHISWNEEMRRFYDWSWGEQNFNIKQIRKMMDASANWKIYTEDRFPKARRFTNLKCYNCCEFGHTRARCPQPKKGLICTMCGDIGHLEPRCPNTICLRCGNKTNVFLKTCDICSHENRLICPICKIRGHSIQLCPDKWRRYHSTTEPNEYPNKKVEYNPMRYCCICAGEGHLPEHCRSSPRFSEYPPIVTDIKSYAKSYNDDLIKFPLGRNVTGYSLISRPCDSVLFKYPVKITTKQYYGRFLNGVGLDHLMNWTEKDKPKRKAESPSKDEPNNKAHKKNYVLNPFAKRCKKSKKLSENKPEGSSNEAAQDKNIETNIVLNTSESSDKRKDKGELPESQSTSHISKTSKPSEDHTLKQNINSKTDQNDETNIYSKFSEQVSSSTPNSKRSKCRKLGPLPDYIPLNDSDDDEESGSVVGNTKKTTSPKNDDMAEDDEETLSVNEGVPCEAKIYLTKFHSRFLLSPEGQKYLADDSKKFDVKTRIEWTSVGNKLIIDGLPSNQDKFHQDLLETFRKLSDNANRKELEKSQKVPKKRDALIRFIQESILQLDKNLGNVTELYKRLQNDRNIPTKNSWKNAEKTRKTLNIILMGQAGLRKGKDNLEVLFNNLKSLKEDSSSEVVPDNIRDIIGECWKYIFSSQQHENYEELIQKYLDMKKKNELPKVKLNYHLLDRKVLDVSLTDEQKQNISKDDGKDKHTGKVENSPNPKQISVIITKPKVTSDQMPPRFWENVRTSPKVSLERNFPSSSFVSDKIREVNRGWKNHCKNLVKKLDEPPVTARNTTTNTSTPSIFWSRECIKFIDACLAMNPSFSSVSAKLLRVQEKARLGLLSNNDYTALLRIHNVLKGKSGFKRRY